MEEVTYQDRIDDKINNSKMLILYFSNKACGACEVIRSKVEKLLELYPEINIIDIDGEKEMEFAAMKSVFSFPLLILYIEGKEIIRIGRNIDFLEFEKSIDRYYKYLS
ncbi:thioredoxin family protein [Clostridium sp. YIM B02555]|uniref:thioredoxin family protein n=1 Tax=Clostridium sp. YIM B02555 TaxID=2911968 RepID=UPI001EEF66A9|nr:thioredoxin family protein [Clostridium sp. YIM B02555]